MDTYASYTVVMSHFCHLTTVARKQILTKIKYSVNTVKS
jgi:hypothetical protein